MNKATIIGLLILVIMVLVIAKTTPDPKNYRVRLTFCDTRPPIVIRIRHIGTPNNFDIQTRNTAVPIAFDKYLNVCNIEVLEIEK